MKEWIEQDADQSSVDILLGGLGVSKIVAELMAKRGFQDPVIADQFLSPKLKHLQDPFLIQNMETAVNRIFVAREKKQQVLIVGDYDVDGISSTVMTKQGLQSLDIYADTIIPQRITEGYGLTKKVLQRGLQGRDYSLVIALDCGTNSVEEAWYLREKGIDLLVVDHHQLKSGDSPLATIVNPHLQEDHGQPWRNLCTAGLCFKLIHALYKKARELDLPDADQLTPRDFLPLCAIGTLADLVPLQGESRIFSHFGIKRLFLDASPGLRAILKECGMNESMEPETEDITYKLAPRINACGRLNEPETAVALLLESDEEDCAKLAGRLTHLNEQRKGIEAELTADALAQAEKYFTDQPAVVVTGSGDGWHPGVVGIVAGKLANSLNKPCLVLAKSEDDEYTGSGRGIPGLNLVEILSHCQDYLTHWGGHPIAVGLGLQESKLEAFTKKFTECTNRLFSPTTERPTLQIDAVVDPQELNYKLLGEINSLGPFGQDNPEPIIAVKGIMLDTPPRKISKGEHFQFSFHNGLDFIRGIAWRMGKNIPPCDQRIDLAFKLRRNNWNGRSSLQLVLEDWKMSSG